MKQKVDSKLKEISHKYEKQLPEEKGAMNLKRDSWRSSVFFFFLEICGVIWKKKKWYNNNLIKYYASIYGMWSRRYIFKEQNDLKLICNDSNRWEIL